MKTKLSSGEEVLIKIIHLRDKGDRSLYEQMADLDIPIPARDISVATYAQVDIPARGQTFIGHAFCSELDNFERKEGVRRAITRAIEVLPRGDRGDIWAKVWNLSRKGGK